MSATVKIKARRFLSRKPRHIANHEEARVHHFIEDRPNLRDQTAFNAGRMNIPG